MLLGVPKSGSSLGEARDWVSYGDTGMKSHQLFICDMRLNVLLNANFHIIQREDFGGCHVEGQLFAVLCRYSRKSSLAQLLVPRKARALVQPHGVPSFPVPF